MHVYIHPYIYIFMHIYIDVCMYLNTGMETLLPQHPVTKKVLTTLPIPGTFSFINASMNIVNHSRGKRKAKTFIGNTRNITNYLKKNKFIIVGTI
jgi:hypothetical protein